MMYTFKYADERWAGLWRSRQDAAAGGAGPWHAKARGAARTMLVAMLVYG